MALSKQSPFPVGVRPERRRLRLAGLIVAAVAGVVAPVLADSAAARQSAPPRVVIAEYDGIIHPIATEFFDDAISTGEITGASAVVVVLRTPGGLLDATRAIVSRMIASRIPVVVFVAPSGSRAASAGFLITLASDVAVMAPGTHIGAAHPVSVGSDQGGGDATMAQKAAEDAAAYARTLAKARGRNETLSADAVTESRAFTESEAVAAAPRLIDFVATDVDDVIRQLDGRRITRFDGHAVTIRTAGATLQRVEMSRRQQFLAALAHPQLAYLLMSLGMLGLVVELWNPGAILPGVAGGLCLLLAFFAFQVLTVNTTGLLLIAFGIALLLLELKVPSFGALGIGGTIALVVGSVMITRHVPGVPVSAALVVPVAVAFAGIFLFLGRLALQAQRAPAVTGAEGLVGETGIALTPLDADEPGQVRVHGEIWRATGRKAFPAGARVRVAGRDGLTLHVDAVETSESQGDTA